MKFRFKRMHYCAALCFILLNLTSYAQKIRFGANSLIDYQTEKGTFNVYVDGELVLKDAFSAGKVNKMFISSKDFKKRTMQKSQFKNSIGKGLCYRFTAKNESGLTLEQSVYAYTDQNFFTIDVKVLGADLSSNEMFPLKGELVTRQDFSNFTSLFVPFDNDTFISYQANLLKIGKDNISSEVTSIYNHTNRNGFVIGTLDHDQWKTGVITKLQSPTILDLTVQSGFTNDKITRDKIAHGFLKGSSITSSKVLFGYFSDWRLGIETYAKTVRKSEKPIVADWTDPTPVGWNSWGVMQEKISLDKAKKVVDFFADELKQFRIGDVCYIDLDSYWDNMLKGDDYSLLKQFADYCRSKNLKPGIYWAPFTDWGFKGGPDRKAKGGQYTYGEMWTKVGNGFHDFDGARALDPTHPGTQMRIKDMISNFKKCGFEMIKIDFLGHAAVESTQFYDSKITTGMQAYKVGMEYLLKCLDNKMLVYAAISPSLASGKYVQVRRIACDAFKSIKDTEYTLNSVTNGWWQTYLYNYIDADHVVLADESEAANVARTLSAIVTGTLITGDDFSSDGQWKARATKVFQNQDLLKIIEDGKAFRPVEGNKGKSASNQFLKDKGKVQYLALFNYENKNASVKIDFQQLGIKDQSVLAVENLMTRKQIDIVHNSEILLQPAEATMLKITLK